MDIKSQEYTFGIGENYHLQDLLGSHIDEDGGAHFRVWAPNALNVEIIGDFTDWQSQPITMTKNESGIWYGYSEKAKCQDFYKYLVTRENGQKIEKIDPMATYFEARPGTCAILEKNKNSSGKIVCGWVDENVLVLRKDQSLYMKFMRDHGNGILMGVHLLSLI